jgi:serine/threonine protein kinase
MQLWILRSPSMSVSRFQATRGNSGAVLQTLHLLAYLRHPTLQAVSRADITHRSESDGAFEVTVSFEPTSHTLAAASANDSLRAALPRKAVAFSLLQAVDFLHLHRVAHQHITSDDVLIPASASSSSPVAAGAAAAKLGNLLHAAQDKHDNYISDRNYRAPEMILGYTGGLPSDVWALGCVLYEIATGKALFALCSSKGDGSTHALLVKEQLGMIIGIIGAPAEDDVKHMPANRQKFFLSSTATSQVEARVMDAAAEGLTEVDPASAPQWAALISQCLQFNPSKRPTVDALLRCELFGADYTRPAAVTAVMDGAPGSLDDVVKALTP